MSIDRWWALWRLVRDIALFGLGLGIGIHETLLHTGPERYGLLMFAAGIFGTPFFLRAGDKQPSREAEQQ